MVSLKVISIICVFITYHLNANDVFVRKDVLELTDDEKETLLEGLFILQNKTSRYNPDYSAWDYFAYVHQYAFDYTFEGAQGHNRWSFLPWHRAFSYLLELEFQEALDDDTFRMPYWDLTNEESTYATLYDEDFLGGDGDVNNSDIIPDTARLNCDNFPINLELTANTSVDGIPCLVRKYGRGRFELQRELPPIDSWEQILNADLEYDIEPYDDFEATFPPYNYSYPPQVLVDSFRARIEGIYPLVCNESIGNASDPFDPVGKCPGAHNLIHSYIGGTVVVGAATLDPIFFMIHNWIDAMWALYQDKYGLYGLNDTFPEEFMNVTFWDNDHFNGTDIKTAMDVFDTRDLGYIYSLQVEDVPEEDDSWWTTERTVGIVLGIVFVSVIVCIGCMCFCKRKRDRADYQSL